MKASDEDIAAVEAEVNEEIRANQAVTTRLMAPEDAVEAGALALFGTMIAVFIGITLVHKEVEKKTIYAVLAKPVSRWEFLVGKYCGLMLTLAVVTGLMAVF